MEDRLTDQSWQNMLKTAPPPLPIWMKTFIDLTAASLPVPHSNFKSEAKWMPVEVLVSIQPEVIELGTQIQVKVVVSGQVTANPEVTIVQGDKTIRQDMKKSSNNIFAPEYTALLESKDFKPGTALLFVKGHIGEEEFQRTQQLILERASGVEDANAYTSELSKRSKLRNSLYQSFPNPFNPEVWIPYEIEKGSDVTVEIYNSLGQIVRVLELGYKSPGRYIDAGKAVYWDGRNSHGEKISSGIYFYKLHAGNFIATGRMISVK